MNPTGIFSRFKIWLLVVILLVLGVIGYQKFFGKPTVITVTGEGVVETVPSQARIIATLGYSAGKGHDALRGARQLLEAITVTLTTQGIKEEEIRTLSFSVTSAGTGETRIYRATGALEVTVSDIKKVDQIAETLLSLGVSDITSISFTVKDAKELEKKAVDEAIANAKERAKEIAKASGKRLTRLVSVTTSETGEASTLTTKGGVQTPGGKIEIRRQAILVYEVR